MPGMLVEAEIWSVVQIDQGTAVLIRPKDGEVAVPIIIDQLQAHSLLIGMKKASMSRPMTHDLMMTVFEQVNVKLERVEITTISDGIFYSQLIITQGEERLSFDARPSDSISLAVRANCPIFIAESVVDTAGVSLSTFELPEEAEEIAQQDVSISVTNLKSDLESKLQKAVEEEDYELAAKLRDQLAVLEDDSASESKDT